MTTSQLAGQAVINAMWLSRTQQVCLPCLGDDVDNLVNMMEDYVNPIPAKDRSWPYEFTDEALTYASFVSMLFLAVDQMEERNERERGAHLYPRCDRHAFRQEPAPS